MRRRPNFLGALLRQGAPVIASTPRDLPREIDDPEPVAAADRIRVMFASRVEPPTDSLMIRAVRYAVLLPLAYRLIVMPVGWLWLVIGFGSTPVLTTIAWLGTACNAAAAGWLLRVPDRRGRRTALLMWLDIAFIVASSLVFTLTVPASLYWPGGLVVFVYLTGTVALWTMCRGILPGVLLSALAVGLQALTQWLGPTRWFTRLDLAQLVGVAGAMLAAVAAGMAALVLIGLATRLSLAIGMRLGEEGERARTERALHDTVLQTLEAIALTEDRPGGLGAARDAARAQALELRKMLLDSPGSPDGLAAELTMLATEMARDGLRAQLAFSDIGDDNLSAVRRMAVRDAAREALRNTIKHAGTREVVVRMEERDGGVVVITRDHGVGYDEKTRPPGFGVSESMKARLAEVGGWCHIESKPGKGTRVTMWVPR